jgi:hypothetical protein
MIMHFKDSNCVTRRPYRKRPTIQISVPNALILQSVALRTCQVPAREICSKNTYPISYKKFKTRVFQKKSLGDLPLAFVFSIIGYHRKSTMVQLVLNGDGGDRRSIPLLRDESMT